MNSGKNFYFIPLICVIIILVSIITPFAIPTNGNSVSKESQSYVWIWGLCYGNKKFFFFLSPFGINLYITVVLLIFCIISLKYCFDLKNNRMGYGKFGEQLFIYNFLMILIFVNLLMIIEYSFLSIPNLAERYAEKIDF